MTFDQKKSIALIAHVCRTPETCESCMFSNGVIVDGLTACYYNAGPVKVDREGCPPEFFLKELLEHM